MDYESDCSRASISLESFELLKRTKLGDFRICQDEKGICDPFESSMLHLGLTSIDGSRLDFFLFS